MKKVKTQWEKNQEVLIVEFRILKKKMEKMKIRKIDNKNESQN